VPRQRLKIAYLCDISPRDRNLYSGGNARIHDALDRDVGDVTILSNRWGVAEPVRRAVHAMPDAVNLRARWRLHLALARLIAREVRTELARARYDVLFSAYSFQSLAAVVPPYPLVTVFTSDATPTVYRNSEIGNWHKSSRIGRAFDGWIERHERRVLGAADLLLWPSDWLKSAADARYGLSDAQSKLLPWGANLDAPPRQVAPPALSRAGALRLLFIGRDWWAKGGPRAHETMQTLRAQGIDARLTIIGCQPPEPHRGPHVTIHPQLDKTVPAELALFENALETAHFVVMPSIESYGFVFCEASAHGVPSLCLRVGGVPVRDGVNGHALPMGSGPEAFAGLIRRYLDDPAAYQALVRTTRQEYEERLNWDAWGRGAAALIDDAVRRKRIGARWP
jgi:glycosyltransferase involved in cell wall biosynthesis